MNQDIKKWLGVVKALADQNAPIRVNYADKPVEEGGRTARVRVLQYDPKSGQTLIEEPGVRELGDRPQVGDELDMLVVQDQLRLVGRCKVLAHEACVLNDTVRIAACRVSPPSKVYSGQLRDLYRAPVAVSIEIPSIDLTLDPTDAEAVTRVIAAEIDPTKSYTLRLCNISGSGMGLAGVADPAIETALQKGTQCLVRAAELPMLDDPLDQHARIVHTQKLNSGDLYLGVSFIFDDKVHQVAVENQLQRLSVWLQREKLKQQRKD